MRIYASFLLVYVVFLTSCHAVDLQCSVSSWNWMVLGSQPYCAMGSHPTITDSNRVIDSIGGKSAAQFTYKHYVTFCIESGSVMNVMPTGIEKFFPRLQLIWITSAKLKSIRKSDVALFTELRVLYLPNNEIELIESDLLELNLNLEYVNFQNNKLKSVGENIFDKLSKLHTALFSGNPCISKSANSKSELPALISELTTKCKSPEELRRIKELQEQKETKEMKEKYCSEDIQALTDKINDQKAKISKLEKRLETCDGNLDTAIDNLFTISYQNSPVPSETSQINFSCVDSDEETCEAEELKVKFPRQSISNVKDQNGKAKATDKVKKLIISGQQTLFLPLGIGKHFPSLTELTVTDSGLYETDSNTFSGLKSLEILNLRNNKIVTVSRVTFKEAEHLLKLDLSFNRLRFIQDGSFAMLNKLGTLLLNNNFLRKISIKSFEGLKELKELKLQNNDLEFITANLFTQSPQLSLADFTNNKCINVSYPESRKENVVVAIVEQCFEPLEIKCEFGEDEIPLQDVDVSVGYACTVQELSIDNSKVKILKVIGNHEDGHGNENITVFVAKDQSIHYIPIDFSKHFANVEKIVIERSKLQSIHKQDFKDLVNLKTVVLHHNSLSDIEDKSFDDAVSLEYLNLGYNSISSLPAKIFAKLTHLKVLILSHNQLNKLSADIIARPNSISEFTADNNKLSEIDHKIIAALKAATRINFLNNTCVNAQVTRKGSSACELLMEIASNCIS